MAKSNTLKDLYRKERRRIQQQIRRMKKRGYTVPEKVLPKKPKKITEASVSRLEKIRPADLYKKSKAQSVVTGKTITGTERRREEKAAAAAKAYETRKSKKAAAAQDWINRVNAAAEEPEPETFEKIRKEKDREDRAGLTDPERRENFDAGQMVYENLKEMLSSIGQNYKKAAEHLNDVLESEISQYGYDKVMESIGSAPEEVTAMAEIAIRYRPGDTRHDSAIRELMTIIRGALPTAEELRDLQDKIDEDAYMEYTGNDMLDWLD